MDGLALSLALIVASAAAPAASLKFHCDAAESANAVYHVACLAGHIPCTQDVFERFWHDTLQWTAADQRELDAWTTGLKKVENAAGPPRAAPYVGNYRSFFPELDARLRILHAALESRSASDFGRRTKQWLGANEAARLHDTIEYFRRRLQPWWESTGHTIETTRVRRVEKTLRSDKMVALARRVSAFVEADAPASDVYVHLIPSPEARFDVATGTFVVNHLFVEVTDAAAPDDLASVSLHELTHYLYETASAAKRLDLMQPFVRAEVPHASAFYALLNEALATATQGLLLQRSRTSDYRHTFIPRLGRSTLPALEEALAKGTTLYQGFADAYVREASRELGADVTNPKFFLTSAAILPSDKAANAYQVFLREFEPVSFVKSDQWRLFPRLNLVFLLAYDELRGLSTAFPDLASYTNGRGFAYLGSRDGQASLCILAGVDAEAIADVVRAFAKLKSVSSSGLQLAID